MGLLGKGEAVGDWGGLVGRGAGRASVGGQRGCRAMGTVGGVWLGAVGI